MSESIPRPGAPPESDSGELRPEPQRALTIRRKRLAGSVQCLNCGTRLEGPFCHYCGQPDRNFMRFFPALMREFLEEFLDLDSRFMRTMKPLLFRPGRLTRDYLEGRRFRYTPPLRLYLFASIGFFLLAGLLSTNALKVGVSLDPESGDANLRIFTTEAPADSMTAEELRQMLEAAGVGGAEDIVDAYEQGQAAPGSRRASNEPFTHEDIKVGGKPWDRETNPLVIEFMPGFVNDRINDEIAESPEKARRINDNPNLIVEQIFDILPATMFLLLPVVALLFKCWYLFARRYYVEHLIYALHNHAFLFVSLIAILLLSQVLVAGWAAEAGWPETAATWSIVAVSVWVPVYMLISLRHVYRQNWFLTIFKFSVIGLSYVTLLALVTSVVAVLGFVLL